MALRPEAWNAATGIAFRRIIDDAGCLQAEACASVAVARDVNCLLGAAAQACLSVDCLAIEAMAAVEGWSRGCTGERAEPGEMMRRRRYSRVQGSSATGFEYVLPDWPKGANQPPNASRTVGTTNNGT